MSADDKMDRGDDIAVIGMAGRFPGARSVDEMWRNACAGIESVSFFSVEELIKSGVPPELAGRPDYVRAKGLCDDVDLFDSAFFEINGREADFMDPQHRVLLECAWESLENAGYDPARFVGDIGIFAGQGQNSYFTTNLLSNQSLVESVGMHVALIGNGADYLTTRISYKLGLKGPSVNIQTACSTSLVAVHIACQSLLNGECDMALAGGVAIPLPVKSGHLYQPTGIMSPDGHCRAFDAKAEGCVTGSGVGMVVLKPLDKALADGDRIFAVVKGSAINNDGGLKVGYAAPSIEGQAKVITEALNIACIDPETVTYVETHGTGTGLGDPIEVSALGEAFGSVEKKGYCAITSLKTNIGHLDAAAGIASFIRAALAVKDGLIPPSLHFERPNPEIDFDNSPFYVNTRLAQWQPRDIPRRAGVSSFGIGGTNAHVILEEPPALPDSSSPTTREWKLLTLSARTPEALDRATSNFAQYLSSNGGLNIADVCYTLQTGRRQFEHRRIAVVRDLPEAAAALDESAPRHVTSTTKPKDGPIAFMFPGQGAQHVNMCRELYERERVFRDQLDFCSKAAASHLGYDLRDRIFAAGEDAADGLNQTEVTQPALFAVEYSLAKLWMSWGIRPQAMIGHSIGEYVAACIAGVFSVEDAMKLVVLRGKLMQSLPKGSMLAVSLPEREMESLIGNGLSLAAVNGPSSCVVSGTPDSIEELKRRLAERQVSYKLLKTSHAFHSSMMEPILDQFARAVGSIKLSAPKIRFISNLTGSAITPEQATDPAYWVRHLREPVRFDDGLRELLKDPDRRLIEVGPGRTLTTLAKRHPERVETQVVCSSLGREGDSEQASLLRAVGEMWLAGADVNWSRYYDGETRRRVSLPTYPFERRRHWVEPAATPEPQAAASRAHAGKKSEVDDWFYVPLWMQTPPQAAPGELAERLCWLFFVDRRGVGESLGEAFRLLNQDSIIVRAGARFERNDDEFTIAPNKSADYVQLLTALASEGRAPSRIVHCWALDDESADTQVEMSFYSLTWLAQALTAQPDARKIDIAVISSQMQKVAGEASLYPEKATLLGPCKVIPQEHPNISCRSIDVVVSGPGSIPRSRLVDRLRAELCAEATDAIVAYRGEGRWIQTIKPSKIGGSPLRPSLLRERGVYLITGGMGGLGLEIARYLAQAARARLVLTGRSQFPDRSEWDNWVSTHPPFDQTSQRINKLRAIEALGGDLLIRDADVTDAAQMSAVLSDARERFGELNGVIHAAGLAGGGVIQMMTGETAARTLEPKLAGARVLEALLAGSDLDFFALFSSVTAITGGFGQSAYCAANAFLDAFAASKSEGADTVTFSIAWDAWREVGMAARLASPDVELGPLTAVGKTDHPLLHHYTVEASERETYVTEFSPERHWVLDEHRIVGNPVIPGAAYLEMARAAFERGNGNGHPVEIRDVFFLTPLRVPDGKTTSVYTVLEKQGPGFRFEMKSPDGARGWQQHAMGAIGHLPNDQARRLPIREIIDRCRRRELAPEGGRLADDDGPRWQSINHVYVGEDEMIAALELKQAFANDLEFMKLHPSLLDVATSSPKQFVTARGNSYLPLSYKRLVMRGPLQPRMYSYGKLIRNTGADDETLTFDVIITDENGVELVEVESFVVKRVNDAALRLQAWEEDGSEAMSEFATDPLRDAMPTAEAIEAFARTLNRPIGSRIIVATRDINEIIGEVNSFSGSGVIKRHGAVGSHPRPNLETPYVAPRSEVEKKIAMVWQELFGIDRVGVDDNFFELGGDSILAIQIITRCAQVGLQIPPQELFQHPTVAELARTVEPGGVAVTAGGGVFPLAPSQVASVDGLTMLAEGAWVVLIRLDGDTNFDALQEAVQRMAAQHQVFRLQFEQDDSGWVQKVSESSGPLSVDRIDLSSEHVLRREPAIRRIASEMASGIDPASSPLARAAIAQFGPGEESVLLLVIHRLIGDEASLPMMLDDICTAYEQATGGRESRPRLEAVPFTRWVERLYEQTDRGFDGGDATSSRAARGGRPLRAQEGSQGAGEPSPYQTFTVRLTTEDTQSLSDQISSAYRARVEEILLTSLVRSLSSLNARRAMTVEVDFDGRQEKGDLDLSRTPGPISVTHPILFDLNGAADPGRSVRTVKEQLREHLRAIRSGDRDQVSGHVSGNGSGAARPRELPPGVGFSLTDWSAADRFRQLPVVSGVEVASVPQCLRPLEVKARIIEGRLEIEFAFDENAHEFSKINELGDVFERELRLLMEHHASSGSSGYTPSDFPLANLDERNLSKLAFLIDKSDAT